jgi:hypothetical protein
MDASQLFDLAVLVGTTLSWGVLALGASLCLAHLLPLR